MGRDAGYLIFLASVAAGCFAFLFVPSDAGRMLGSRAYRRAGAVAPVGGRFALAAECLLTCGAWRLLQTAQVVRKTSSSGGAFMGRPAWADGERLRPRRPSGVSQTSGASAGA
jgi:hypothetical protein